MLLLVYARLCLHWLFYKEQKQQASINVPDLLEVKIYDLKFVCNIGMYISCKFIFIFYII